MCESITQSLPINTAVHFEKLLLLLYSFCTVAVQLGNDDINNIIAAVENTSRESGFVDIKWSINSLCTVLLLVFEEME